MVAPGSSLNTQMKPSFGHTHIFNSLAVSLPRPGSNFSPQLIPVNLEKAAEGKKSKQTTKKHLSGWIGLINKITV